MLTKNQTLFNIKQSFLIFLKKIFAREELENCSVWVSNLLMYEFLFDLYPCTEIQLRHQCLTMMTNLISCAWGFSFFCLQQASVALLPLQQFLRASHTVLQLWALSGLHHQPLLHRWIISSWFLVAMFAGNVWVLEGWERGGGAGRRGGGSGGCSAQLLQGVGHKDLTPAHVLIRCGWRWSRIAAVVRVKVSPHPLQMLPGLLPQLQIRVSVAPGHKETSNKMPFFTFHFTLDSSEQKPSSEILLTAGRSSWAAVR